MPNTLIDLELTFRGSPLAPTVAASMRDQRDSDFKELAKATVSISLTELLEHSADPPSYGRALAAMLFADLKLRDAWNRVQAYAAGAGADTNWRLRLRFEDGAEALQALRWECLYDPDSQPVIANGQVLLLRYVPSADLRRVQSVSRESLRVIAAIASPRNSAQYSLERFDAGAELQRVRAAFASVPHLRIFAPDAEAGRATPETLVDALQEGCDLFYLVCHGALVEGAPHLWLEDEKGDAVALSGEAITRLMRSLPAELRPSLVVLGSCHTAGRNEPEEVVGALAPQLARDGVPAVLAMQGYAPLNMIERYIPAFLRELFRSGRIDQAVAVARRTVPSEGSWMPALYLRSHDGRLWPGAPQTTEDPISVAPSPLPEQKPLSSPVGVALLTGRTDSTWVSQLRQALALRGLVARPGEDDDERDPGTVLAGAAAAVLQLNADRLDDDLASELEQLRQRRINDQGFTLYAHLEAVSEQLVKRAGIDLRALGAIVIPANRTPAEQAGRILQNVLERYQNRFIADRTIEVGLFSFDPSGPGAKAPLRLDWRGYFDQRGARFPSEAAWEQELMPALADLRKTLGGQVEGIRLHIQSRLSTGIAFGHRFRSTAQIGLYLPQRDGEWRTAPYDPSLKPLDATVIELDPAGSELAIELPLTQKLIGVDDWIQQRQTPLRRRVILAPVAGSGFTIDATSAHAIACQVRRVILDHRVAAGKQTHLFGAMPAALAAMIGWHLNTCEPIQCYELKRLADDRTALEPACLLEG